MTTERPYAPALSTHAAFTEVQAQSGKQLDPACVQAFLRLRPRVEEMK